MAPTATQAAPQSPPIAPWRGRWIVAVVLGLLAGWANFFDLPILSQETPSFIFGGALTLFVVVRFGLGPGLVAAVAAMWFFMYDLFDEWALIGLGGLVYVAEVAWVGFFARRIRSIVLSVTVFWLCLGWIFDLVFYVGLVGVSADYILILYVKQLLNGVANGLIAEFLTRLPARRGEPALAMGRTSVEEFAFDRMVLLTMLPVAVFALGLARSHWQRVENRMEFDNRRAALEVASDVEGLLLERLDAVRSFLNEYEDHPDEAPALLEETATLFDDVDVLGLVDATGVVTAGYPPVSFEGEEVAGQDVSFRPYFQLARDSLRTHFSDVYRGLFPVREGSSAYGLMLAEPIFDREGFHGIVALSFDPVRLIERTDVLPELEGGTVTLIDRAGAVIVSQAGTRLPLASADSLFGGAEVVGLRGRLGEAEAAFSFYDPTAQDELAQIGLNLHFAAIESVPLSEWSVIVDRHSSYLWTRLRPVSLTIVAIFFLTTLAVLVVVKRFSYQLASPYRIAAGVARQITEGRPGSIVALEDMERSPLAEVLDLSESLGRMDEALMEKDLKTQEREEDLQRQLLQAQKMEAIGLLAGGVAHDFNNTLTPILGYADLGREFVEDEEARDYFEQIGEAAARAKEITTQLLAFGRKQTLEIRSVSLTEEIRKSEKLLRPLLRENIKLDIELSDYRGMVLADAAQLHQILVNLAVNARDAMPDGGTLRIRVHRVGTLPIRPDIEEMAEPGPHVMLTISDTGGGIPEVVLPHIFEPFFTTKGESKGTGLGLSTVYGIVRQHGGLIDVQSEAGEGTTFVVCLPEVEIEQQEEAGEDLDLPEIAPGSGRVLMVEDDDAVRRLVGSVLEREGYEVIAHSSAEDALAWSASNPAPVDLLISDVMLPGMNGRELYDELERERPNLNVVFVSGYSHDVLSKTGLPARAHLLMKPFRRRELMDLIRQVLGASVETV